MDQTTVLLRRSVENHTKDKEKTKGESGGEKTTSSGLIYIANLRNETKRNAAKRTLSDTCLFINMLRIVRLFIIIIFLMNFLTVFK